MAPSSDDALLAALWSRLQPLVLDVVRAELEAGKADDGYMTPSEAADYARLKPATIRDWVKSGKLGAKRVGRQLRITRADLEQAMSGGRASRGGESVEQRAKRAAERALAKR